MLLPRGGDHQEPSRAALTQAKGFSCGHRPPAGGEAGGPRSSRLIVIKLRVNKIYEAPNYLCSTDLHTNNKQISKGPFSHSCSFPKGVEVRGGGCFSGLQDLEGQVYQGVGWHLALLPRFHAHCQVLIHPSAHLPVQTKTLQTHKTEEAGDIPPGTRHRDSSLICTSRTFSLGSVNISVSWLLSTGTHSPARLPAS